MGKVYNLTVYMYPDQNLNRKNQVIRSKDRNGCNKINVIETLYKNNRKQ